MAHNVGQELADAAATQTEIIQTELSSIGLGDATIAAQQALSEKFGIVTFDIEGNVSTVPISRKIDPAINVGTGRFTSSAFQKSVQVLTKQLTAGEKVTNFFRESVITPITDFINSLFTGVSLDDLDAGTRNTIELIDKEMTELQQRITTLQIQFGIDISNAKRIGTSRRQLIIINQKHEQALRETERFLANLIKRRNKILKQFVADTTIKDRITSLTEQMKTIANIEPLTAQLKATMDNLIQEGSAIIEKMLSDGYQVQREIISNLQQAMLALTFRIQEPVQSGGADLTIGLQFIGEGLFGIGTVIAEAFEKIFVPDTSALKDQLIKFGIAQRLAAMELAKT